jgi:cytidylate kinase
MVIAIDGPAGAGKSSVARGLAEALGYTYLDSGAMYRSVALAVLRAGAEPDDASAVAAIAGEAKIAFDGHTVLLAGEDVTEAIRAPEITTAASRVSIHPEVRAAMVERQRELIERGRYVAEGRDIGTVVSPGAALKVYMVASDEERARRRSAQTGEPLEAVRAAHADRDARDRVREHGALRPADDAVELDTTDMELEEVIGRLVEMARERGLART